MKLFVVLLSFIFTIIIKVNSQTCTGGFTYLESRGCYNGPDYISTAICTNSTDTKFFIGDDNTSPCPNDYTTVSFGYQKLNTTNINVLLCSLDNGKTTFSQVGFCPNNDYAISNYYTFNNTNKYFTTSACIVQGEEYITLNKQLLRIAVSDSNVQCTGNVVDHQIFNFGISQCTTSSSETYPNCLPDTNECLQNPCNNETSNAICVNIPSSYYCQCLNGYGYDVSNKDCVDINECSQSTSVCGGTSTCVNSPGSFNCVCKKGYSYDETTKECLEINECLTPGICGTDECVNTDGSYYCNCLKTGYIFDFETSVCVPLIYHSISSVSISGTNSSFYGSFGEAHNDLSLFIGDGSCEITYKSASLILCNALPGIGIKSVNLTQNGISFIGINIYNYPNQPDTLLKCPNDCFSILKQGYCNSKTGQCICDVGYGSFDCSGTTVDDGEESIIINGNSTNINNAELLFNVQFKTLNEVGIDGTIIKSYDLQNQWIKSQSSSNNTSIYNQILNGTNCNLISTIQEFTELAEYTFGDTNFIVEKGMVKFTIQVLNYTYSNYLNTLQLVFVSSVDENHDDLDHECNQQDTEIQSIENSNKFSLIKISKNNKIFSGRFLNIVESDGRLTQITTSIIKQVNSIIATIHLPHASNLIVDPDFTVLISSNYRTDCEKKRPDYFLPVVIIFPILGAAIIIVILFCFYKNNSSVKVGVKKIKLNKL